MPRVEPDRGMGKYAFDSGKLAAGTQKACGRALSGSNQAREGRLVDALAARGDEGRDTLR